MQTRRLHVLVAYLALALSVLALWVSWPGSRTVAPDARDEGLRQFLGMRSIAASIDLPPGDHYFALKLLHIEDGKLVGKGIGLIGQVRPAESRRVEMQVVWGRHEGKFMMAAGRPGFWTTATSDFWEKLDGGLSALVGQPPEDDFEGYGILGFVQSNLRRDGTNDDTMIGDFGDAIRLKKYVGAVGIRTYRSQEDLTKGEYH